MGTLTSKKTQRPMQVKNTTASFVNSLLALETKMLHTGAPRTTHGPTKTEPQTFSKNNYGEARQADAAAAAPAAAAEAAATAAAWTAKNLTARSFPKMRPDN